MKRILSFLVVLLLPALFSIAQAADCRKLSEVCVDGPSTKQINGVNVTRDCWQYEAVYECVEGNAVNYCEPLTNAGCYQHAVPVCVATAFNGTCLEYQNTMRCADEQLPVPPNVSFLEIFYSITNDTINNQCVAQEGNQLCTFDSEVCVEGPETRNINGLDVYKNCWRWERNYTCGVYSNAECTDLNSDPYCNLTATTCVDYLDDDPQKPCLVWDKQYTCTNPNSGGTQTQTTCDNKVTCINGFCFSSGSPADKDMANTVAWMEIARQAGVYQDPDTLEIFKGYGSQCRVRAFGSCCKVKGPGQATNSGAYGMSSFGQSLTGQVLREATKFVGSKFTYDSLFMNSSSGFASNMNYSFGGQVMGGIPEMGMSDIATQTMTPSGPSISLYGLQVTYSPVKGLTFDFDPYSLALAVVQYIITEILTCSMDQNEGILALRRGANLCHYVGSYCSKKILGWCYERKQGYCCYNSKLAKLINVQGKAQLGLGFGSPAAPNCSGFSPTQLSSLDLSAMDLSEFYKDIVPKQLDVTGTVAVVTDNVNCKTENASYFGVSNPACNKSVDQGVIYTDPYMKP